MRGKIGKRRTVVDVPEILFHGTGVRELLMILHSDSLEGLAGGDDGPSGVSLTKKYRIARSFAEEVSARAVEGSYSEDYDLDSLPECDLKGCVLEIDGVSIVRAGADLRPYTDQPEYYDHEDEAEERVLGTVESLHLHLRKFYARYEDIEWHRQLYEAAGEPEMAALCDIALYHPLRISFMPASDGEPTSRP